MRTELTIRNCDKLFRVQCPKRWDELQATEMPKVRHCGQCNRNVHWCRTDEETIAHARAGDCIAREVPVSTELSVVYIGQPRAVPPETPEQKAAWALMRRESGIDDAIKNANAKRACPECHYPAPGWRVTCRVCGYEMGRDLDA